MLWLALEPLLTTFGAMIFVLLSLQIAKSLNSEQSGVVGFILRVTTAPLQAALQLGVKIVKVMAPTAAQSEHRVGVAFHDTANLVRETATVVEAQSLIAMRLAQEISGSVSTADFAKTAAALTKRVGNAETQAKGIGADVLPRIRAVEKGIGADVLPNIRSLDRALGRIEAKTIPAIQGEIAASDRAIGHLWDYVKSHTVNAASLAFVGAAGWALARLGGGWIRCRNWNKVGKAVCGLPTGLIDDLLALSLALLVVVDPKVIAEAAIKTEDAVHGIITKVAEIDDPG